MKKSKFEKKWLRWVHAKHILAIVLLMACTTCLAGDFGAITNGNWNDASTWTPGSIPGASDDVWIGSNYPDGSASTATVTLTQDQSAKNVHLGYYYGFPFTNGILDLGNSKLTVQDELEIGWKHGEIQRGSGSFSCNLLSIWDNSLTFGAQDVASALWMASNLTATTTTTTATGNVTHSVYITEGGKLTLGADMTLTGFMGLKDTGSTLDMAGHSLNASSISLGYNGIEPSGGSPTILNRGRLTTNVLRVANITFDLNATDSVSGDFWLNNGASTLNSSVSFLYLKDNSTAATTATGNVTDNVIIYSGSKLTLGADMTLGFGLQLQDTGSILDMAGHTLEAGNISFGLNGDGGTTTLLNRGRLITYSLSVANQTFDLYATDSVSGFYLSNGTSTINTPISNLILDNNSTATWNNPLPNLELDNNSTATTTAAANVTDSVYIRSGGKLTLGADMTLSGDLRLQDDGSTLDMASHALNANQIFFGFGWYGDGGTPTLLNRGRLTANSLYVANQTFDLNATDSVSNFSLSNGTSTINTPLVSLYLSNNSTATWNNLLSSLSLDSNSTAATTAAANVSGDVAIYSGSKLTMGADMTLSGNLYLQDTGSSLDMAGHSLSASEIYLGMGDGTTTLLNGGKISANYLDVENGNVIVSSIAVDTLTIESGATLTIQAIPGGPLGSTITAVPEPSTLVLIAIGAVGLLAYAWRSRRRVA